MNIEEQCGNIYKQINAEKVLVYGMQGCLACVKAKDLLFKNSVKYSDMLITEMDDNDQECLFAITRSSFVPQIFINSRYIGGYNELKYLSDSGILKDIVPESKNKF
jgi:glutaredoxin 3